MFGVVQRIEYHDIYKNKTFSIMETDGIPLVGTLLNSILLAMANDT